jgi:hypothetical protein
VPVLRRVQAFRAMTRVAICAALALCAAACGVDVAGIQLAARATGTSAVGTAA